MGDTKIQWTDATWNPVRGCTKISPGCKHCYAETFAERFRGVKGHPYEQGFDLRLVPEKLDEPLHWKKPRRVFVNSMSDLFHEDVPDDYIAAVFGIMAAAPQHTFQILTKRAERLHRWFAWADRHRHGDGGPDGGPFAAMVKAVSESEGIDPRFFGGEGDEGVALARALDVAWPLPNVWLGVSVEDQARADERIPVLLQTPAAVRFLSCEPLLGPVSLQGESGKLVRYYLNHPSPSASRISWVIVGGESGHGARPCALEWIESVVAQCRAARVPVFCKQLGAVVVSEARTAPADCFAEPPGETFRAPDGNFWAWRMGLDDRKGGEPAEWPAGLRVREFPESRNG